MSDAEKLRGQILDMAGEYAKIVFEKDFPDKGNNFIFLSFKNIDGAMLINGFSSIELRFL